MNHFWHIAALCTMTTLAADVSLRALHPEEQLRGRSWYAIPELQLQVQPSHGVLRPYVGAGGGWSIGTGKNVTASGAVGLRYLPDVIPFGARAELRVLGIGTPFGGATAEWTFGVTYRVRRGGVQRCAKRCPTHAHRATNVLG